MFAFGIPAHPYPSTLSIQTAFTSSALQSDIPLEGWRVRCFMLVLLLPSAITCAVR